jgi:hypothetical protein
MQFWGYLARPDVEAELRAEFERRGVNVEQVFAEQEAGSKNALADLLVESSNQDLDAVLIASQEELSPNALTRRVILHEFRQRHIAVWSLDRWRWRECLTLKEQIDQLERTDFDAWHEAAMWWHHTFDLAHDAEAPSCATVGEVITESDKFRDLLRAAVQRQRQKEGKRPGRAAFGGEPDERPVIQRILVWHRDGTGYTAIANKLNEEGYRTLTGKHFRPQTVKNYALRYGGDGKEGAAKDGR